MKYIIASLLFFLVACALPFKVSKNSNLHYDKILSLKIGTDTEGDIIKFLGAPTNRSSKTDHYTFNFDDPKTGFQRLSLNFLKQNKKLLSILWIPHENEFTLQKAKSDFKDAHFKKVSEENSNPHMVLDIVNFVDENLGISIRYNNMSGSVEGISMFDVNTRIPASSEEAKKTQFTIGDELSSF